MQLSNRQYELIRGVFWNDDPNCLLFENDLYNNMKFGWGLEFGLEFKQAEMGKTDPTNLTYRSHFGNLQFVHSMGALNHELPSETLRKIKLWLQTMYLVYSGLNNVTPDTSVKTTELKEFFNDNNGHEKTTFKSLLMGETTRFDEPFIQWRALGSCLHVIQDSFARGHCRQDDDGTGSILNFHCYNGQDHAAHSHYDGKGGEYLDPTKLDSFNGIYGGRAAINRCTQFLDIASAGQPWSSKLDQWFEDTFALSAKATPTDTSV